MNTNPLIWFAERELNFVPRHFVKCPTPVTFQSKQWIQNKITGRYAFVPLDRSDRLSTGTTSVFFEDEKDAVMYELLWASSSN